MLPALALVLAAWLTALSVPGDAQTPRVPRALIVYDEPQGGGLQKLGLAYAIMLRNLLGHFDAKVTIMPVREYRAGNADSHDAVFYLGTTYDYPVGDAFVKDVLKTNKTVVWFKYNLWQATRYPPAGFKERFGFTFQKVRSFNAAPSAANPDPGFFSQVKYKGELLDKYYRFDETSDGIVADPDIGVVDIVNPAVARTIVPIRNPATGESVPYVVNSGNFWYFADNPLSYIGPRDRYLVLADLLHDILRVRHAENHVAMIRLEDVNAMVSVAGMDAVTALLARRGIPFSVAAIPRFKDPFGKYSNGVPRDIPLAKADNFNAALKMALDRGGEIVMHGFTHQYASTPNPHTAVSGEDFEFWDVRRNAPLPEDSIPWTLRRINAGLREFAAQGIRPVAWSTPHYQASPKALRASARLLPVAYERAFYYTSDSPRLDRSAGRDFAVNQFFPYPIGQDYYGRRVIPENLGNMRYAGGHGDGRNAPNEAAQSWAEMQINARYALIVRDGYASFFFHPYLADPASGGAGLADLERLLDGIDSMGYTWASPRDLRKAVSGVCPPCGTWHNGRGTDESE